jgi:hypothetical protein
MGGSTTQNDRNDHIYILHIYIYDEVGIYQQKEKKGKTHIPQGK